MEMVMPWTSLEKPAVKQEKAGLATARKKPEFHWRLTLPPELFISEAKSALSLWASLTRFLRRVSLLRAWLAVLPGLAVWSSWVTDTGKPWKLWASADIAISQVTVGKESSIWWEGEQYLVGRRGDPGLWSRACYKSSMRVGRRAAAGGKEG